VFVAEWVQGVIRGDYGITDLRASAPARPHLTRFPREHENLPRFRDGRGAWKRVWWGV